MARIPSREEWQCFQKLSATEMWKSLCRMGYLVYQGLAWRSHLLSYIQLWWHPCRLMWDYSQANDIVAWLVSEIFYPILFYRTLKMLSCILQKKTVAFHKIVWGDNFFRVNDDTNANLATALQKKTSRPAARNSFVFFPKCHAAKWKYSVQLCMCLF